MNWNPRLATLVAAAVLILAAAPGLAAGPVLPAGPVVPPKPSLKVSAKADVGTFLADASGKTLYTYRKDVRGMSACAGPCMEKWSVFFREVIVAPEGLDPNEFATLTRTDGKRQTTYKGRPLYTFAGDLVPGATDGHGMGEAWYVASP